MNTAKKIGKNCFKIEKVYHILAIGFGSGFSPVFPGTVGSLAAIPFWYLMSFLSQYLYFLILLLSTIIGIYLCSKTEKDIGVHDHNSIVWDEFIGMWITLMLVPRGKWLLVLIAFLIFRILDIWKPWPIRWFDHNISGGIGIMVDDIVAGIISAYFISLCKILLY